MSKKIKKREKTSVIGAKGLLGDANSGMIMVFPDGNWALIACIYLPHPTDDDKVYFELRRDCSEMHMANEPYTVRITQLQRAGLIVVNYPLNAGIITYFIVPSPHVPLNFFIGMLGQHINEISAEAQEYDDEYDEENESEAVDESDGDAVDETVASETAVNDESVDS